MRILGKELAAAFLKKQNSYVELPKSFWLAFSELSKSATKVAALGNVKSEAAVALGGGSVKTELAAPGDATASALVQVKAELRSTRGFKKAK